SGCRMLRRCGGRESEGQTPTPSNQPEGTRRLSSFVLRVGTDSPTRSTWHATHALSALELGSGPAKAGLHRVGSVHLQVDLLKERIIMQAHHSISRRRWFEMVGAA